MLGKEVLTSGYYALYRLVKMCSREAELGRKLRECSCSALARHILFFIIYPPEVKYVSMG